MSLIDLASLVLAPTAVKDGKVYNAIPNDQDFTFSRGTEATRVNSAGLIEKARTNLLLQSNTFDTTWTTSNASVTGGQSGYDGSSDAWLLESTSTAFSLYQNYTQSGVSTFSIFAKKGTSASFGIDIFTSVSTNAQFFNLSNGTLDYSTGSVVSADIIDKGNGWYHCIVTTNNTGTIYYARITNGVGNTYIQSAQLEQGLVSTDVITTTTTSVTVGITDDLPRVDYSGGGCPSLLLEGSRTNINTQSEYFGSSSWNKARMSITDNAVTSPEGVQNGANFVEDSTSNSHPLYDTFTVSSGTSYTVSMFVKKGSRDYFRFNAATSSAITFFNLADGTVHSGTGGIEDFGNGWYRCSMTFTAASTSEEIYIEPSINGSSANYQGDGSVSMSIYGFQLEAGSYPTSYIPSYGTSTSRSADSCSLTNASNLFNNDTAVWLIDIERMGIDYTDIGDSLTLKDGSNVRQITLWFDAPLHRIRFRDGKNSFTTIGSSGGVIETPAGERKKIALKIDGTTLKVFADGVQKGSNYTRPTAFDFTKMDMTGIGYKIKNVQFYTTALTDAQVIELTK